VRRVNVSFFVPVPLHAPKIIHRADGIRIENSLQVLLLNVQILAGVWNRHGIGRTEPDTHYLGTRTCSDDAY